ncbi:alpha/beta hydrolase domain-containing protein 13 [Striga asiatica]|uniref:Alpha/beta hydrolase domain-containing protein 13 n=1 Tax=Striga asiatica TaxID=4170 RepID=A0A5A7PQQ1_STRAF|nr:alpha/beta hydrolase domain-containing protein 13 [Striga asiatica]
MTTVTRRTKINIRIVEVNVWSLVSMRAGALILAALVPTIPSTPALIKGLVSSATFPHLSYSGELASWRSMTQCQQPSEGWLSGDRLRQGPLGLLLFPVKIDIEGKEPSRSPLVSPCLWCLILFAKILLLWAIPSLRDIPGDFNKIEPGID